MTLVSPPRLDYAARFTIAEFEHICLVDAFGDMKIELVDGQLERLALSMSDHALLQASLLFRLVGSLSERRVLATVGVAIGEDTVVACDAAVLHVPTDKAGWLGPDDIALIVEVAAETTIVRDLGMKRAKYAAAGIGEYWVIDGARSVVHVFAEPIEGEYAANRTVRFGEPLAVPGSDRTIVID